jgi:hypothetical protein
MSEDVRAKHRECYHPRCRTHVPSARFACRPHWYSLPKPLRDRIWSTYVPGQEVTMTASDEYLAAAHACMAYWGWER